MDIRQKQLIIANMIMDLKKIKKTIWDIDDYFNATRLQDITSHLRFKLKMASLIYKNRLK